MFEALAALAKALLYAGILCGAGSVFAQATLRGSPEAASFLARVARVSALVVIVAAIANAVVLALRLSGEFDRATLTAVFSSSAGAAFGLQLTGAVLLFTDTSYGSGVSGTRLSYALLLVLSFVFSGHAASLGPPQGLVAFAHVCLASWWVGSLWMIRHECTGPQAVSVIKRFSAIATIAVGALVIAGLILIAALVDFSTDPWLLAYGQMLAVKIAVAAGVMALAAYNKLKLTPRLMAGDPAAMIGLRKTAGAELAVIAVVLAATAILTTYSSPFE
jgi:putative copper export protein